MSAGFCDKLIKQKIKPINIIIFYLKFKSVKFQYNIFTLKSVVRRLILYSTSLFTSIIIFPTMFAYNFMSKILHNNYSSYQVLNLIKTELNSKFWIIFYQVFVTNLFIIKIT